MLNRPATGNRLRHQFVDSEIGKPVGRADQVNGYEAGAGEYVLLDPEDVAAAVPESDRTLAVLAFISCAEIDDAYFDRPGYLVPADRDAEETYFLIREGMRAAKVAALARTVPFRRVRTVLIRAQGPG